MTASRASDFDIPLPLDESDYGSAPSLPAMPRAVTATPFVHRDPHTLPRRQWLHARHYIRRFVSTTVAPGGVGKTSHSHVEAASMASGLALLGGESGTPISVWVINLEDPADELERRMAAVMLHYRLEPSDIEGRLYVDSGRQLPLKIAIRAREDVVIVEPLVTAIIEEIKLRRIDCLIVDPFVSCHSVPENDNGAIDAVAKTWARIADETNCAVELVHHVRKPSNGSQNDYTIDDARGAVALIGAARSARVLNAMSKEDADKAGVPVEERRSYFRVDNGKANMAPPVDQAVWRKLVGVPLDNGDEEHAGDWVAVATAWEMPSAFEGLSTSTLKAVQDKIAAGRWAENVQATNWAGYAVAEVLEIDASSDAGKQRVKTLLKTWIHNKALKVERQRSQRDGREKPMIIVGEWA